MEEIQTKSSKWVWVFVVAIIAVGVVMWWKGSLGFLVGGSGSYQAVFLSNGQVYFGKLNNARSQFAVLTDVYYLQATQTLQPKEQNAPAVPNLNLIKLGGELHGPADEMVLNRDHILFYETLKSDSQVATAIAQYKADQNKK